MTGTTFRWVCAQPRLSLITLVLLLPRLGAPAAFTRQSSSAVRLTDCLGQCRYLAFASFSPWVPRSRCCALINDAVDVRPLSRGDIRHQEMRRAARHQLLAGFAANGSTSLHGVLRR
jgi:hypothetical protein